MLNNTQYICSGYLFRVSEADQDQDQDSSEVESASASTSGDSFVTHWSREPNTDKQNTHQLMYHNHVAYHRVLCDPVVDTQLSCMILLHDLWLRVKSELHLPVAPVLEHNSIVFMWVVAFLWWIWLKYSVILKLFVLNIVLFILNASE